MDFKTFDPVEGKTTAVANSTSATSAVVLPVDCNGVAISNASATAICFVRVTYYDDANNVPTGDAPTVTTDMPILPGQQIRRSVQPGRYKVIRTIASAADGTVYITPGSGF